MRLATRLAYNTMLTAVATSAGVASATEQFVATPSLQQKIVDKTQESSAFLQAINLVTVPEQSAELLGLNVGQPVGGRTDTSGSGTRTTRDPSSIENRTYFCRQTNFDTHMRYAKMDMWAKFTDFQARVRNMLLRNQALFLIMVGFNGTSYAATTDATANPLGQDVHKGWLQNIRDNATANAKPYWMKRGAVAANGVNKIYISKTGTADYTNLDALVFDTLSLLDPWARNDPGLVVVVSQNLVDDKYFPIINNTGDTPTEVQAAADIIVSAKQIGGKKAVAVPYFPDNTILLTTLDNLSIYEQEGTRRRNLKDVPERDRVENYESTNLDYVVEDYGYAVLIENIEKGPKPA